jgi:glucose/mannose-6-phosphate isomerase
MITHQGSLESFYRQISFVKEKYRKHGLNAEQFRNIVAGGLGGSGIGGKIAKNYFRKSLSLPVEVIHDYSLPVYVDNATLLIIGSYSGNTEETLAMYDQARERGAAILVITSGGELEKKAAADQCLIYKIEEGFQPRMALGYSLTYLLKILAELGNINIDGELDQVIESLRDNTRHKSIAEGLQKKFRAGLNRRYVIISDTELEGVAIRFAQQLNENSKQEAFVSVLPEANHNVIESYYGQLPCNFIVLNSHSNERVSARFDFICSLLERENNRLSIIETEGAGLVTVFDLIHALDWFTVNITEEIGVDPMEIANIVSLKKYISEVQ